MKITLSFLSLCFVFLTIKAQTLHTYEGKIIDAENGTVLPFVRIQLSPSNVGTLSNSDGAFSLKVPTEALEDQLIIHHLGYEVLQISLNDYSNNQQFEIQLTPKTYNLEAVLITPQDPRDLIREALKNFPENHPFYTRKMSAFYRENASVNDTILDIAEAVVDAYVYADKPGAPYKSKVKPVKVRKLTNRGPNDTLMDINLTGSTLNPALQKRPDDTGIGGELDLKSFLNPETFKFYTYEIKGITEFYGREVYIIHFDQDKRFGSKLYKGEIYLDMRTLAFARVKFSFSDKGKRFRFTQLQEGFKMGLMKGLLRLGGIQLDIRQHSAQIDYQYNPEDGRWHKHFVNESFNIWFKLPKWIFSLMLKESDEFNKKERKEMAGQINKTYDIKGSYELLITDIQRAGSVPNDKSWDRKYDPLKEDLVDNDDPFWKNYNYIKPSTSLQNMEARIKASIK